MIREIIENEYYRFVKEVVDWKEAVKISCSPLEVKGIISQNCAVELIKDIEDKGVNEVVIFPHIAIIHNTHETQCVYGSAIGFAHFKEPVLFKSEELCNKVKIILTIISYDDKSREDNIAKVVMALINSELVREMKEVRDATELYILLKKYQGVEGGKDNGFRITGKSKIKRKN